MNIKNNKRKKESQLRIQKVFMELIQNKELKDIKVADICKLAKINRSTFYSNYLDVYDLAAKIKEYLYEEVLNLYKKEQQEKKHSYDFLKLFYHIKENQIFYKTFFKLNDDNSVNYFEYLLDQKEMDKYYHNQNIDYHVTFFMSGFNAVIKKWLNSDCYESPETILEIIESEYKNKKLP